VPPPPTPKTPASPSVSPPPSFYPSQPLYHPVTVSHQSPMPAPSPTLIADAALLATLNKAMYHTGYHPSSSFQASPGAIRVKWLHSIGLVKGQVSRK